MTTMEEDEWEYEYDENESEDFYITVDLSNVADKQNATKPMHPLQPMLVGSPMMLHNRLRMLNTIARNGDATLEPVNIQDEEKFSEMQITGLHTSNPLIMYNEQLLSCEWASTIGTDLFFVKPVQNPDPHAKPLRSLPSVDLIGIGSAKLMAKAARLEPRDEVIRDHHEGVEMAETSASDVSKDGNRTIDEVQIGNADVMTEQTRNSPSGFLARLNEAKAKRGDKTRLVIGTSANGPRLSVQKAIGPPRSTGASASSTMDTTMDD